MNKVIYLRGFTAYSLDILRKHLEFGFEKKMLFALAVGQSVSDPQEEVGWKRLR